MSPEGQAGRHATLAMSCKPTQQVVGLCAAGHGWHATMPCSQLMSSLAKRGGGHPFMTPDFATMPYIVWAQAQPGVGAGFLGFA